MDFFALIFIFKVLHLNIIYLDYWVLLPFLNVVSEASASHLTLVPVLIGSNIKSRQFIGHLGGSVSWASDLWFWLRSWSHQQWGQAPHQFHTGHGACLWVSPPPPTHPPPPQKKHQQAVCNFTHLRCVCNGMEFFFFLLLLLNIHLSTEMYLALAMWETMLGISELMPEKSGTKLSPHK